MTLDTETLLSGSDIKKTRDESRDACYTGYRAKCNVGQSARLLALNTRVSALRLSSDPFSQHLFGIWDLKNKYVLPSLSNARSNNFATFNLLKPTGHVMH